MLQFFSSRHSVKIPLANKDTTQWIDFRINSQLRENISHELNIFVAKNKIDLQSPEEIKIVQFNARTKRIVDTSLALALLSALTPLILLIALAIKIESKGPVFFIQQRTGIMGRRFKMYKFRTMVQNAEDLKTQLSHLNSHGGSSPDFKVKNDPRITRLGQFLRKTSLDEIPQLFNVVLGNMRLVGPRPTSFSADTYIPHQLSRLMVFPGLTGLWQVSGRSDINFDDRVRLDCQYILTQSPLLDLKILLKTPVVVIKGHGAY